MLLLQSAEFPTKIGADFVHAALYDTPHLYEKQFQTPRKDAFLAQSETEDFVFDYAVFPHT